MIVNDRITVNDAYRAMGFDPDDPDVAARIRLAEQARRARAEEWARQFEAIRRAAQAVGEGLNRLVARYFDHMRRLHVAFAPLLPKLAARQRAVQAHGRWNVAGDGSWQTDLCAAWVHDSCPAPGHCDCTCHGGSVQ